MVIIHICMNGNQFRMVILSLCLCKKETQSCSKFHFQQIHDHICANAQIILEITLWTRVGPINGERNRQINE